MGLIAKDSGGGDYKKVPPGVHIGRCFRIVDLGTQEVVWEGETKLQPKVSIYWELHGEDEQGQPLMADDGEPMTIFSTYTNSIGKKAKLRADLESWRGKPFTDEELKGFDISKLINAYCMVNVVHTERDGKTYANVQSLTPLPSALRNARPSAVLPNVIFNIDDFDDAVFATFHEKLREKIDASLERKQARFPASKNENPQSAQSLADLESDIPF